jgi:hypothetical protein
VGKRHKAELDKVAKMSAAADYGFLAGMGFRVGETRRSNSRKTFDLDAVLKLTGTR